MKNLLDIKCPKCGNTDNLYVASTDREAVYLGPWWVPGDEDKIAGLKDYLRWDSPISCQSCFHMGPFSGFDGDLPAQIREARVMARFRELITLDYRQK